MPKTYSLYEVATGLFTGKRLRCEEEELLTVRLPMGTMAVEGDFDPSTQRMHTGSGTVVTYVPAGAFNGEDRRAAILAQIQDLESKQGRAVREATLGDKAALQRLKEIDASIAALREDLEEM